MSLWRNTRLQLIGGPRRQWRPVFITLWHLKINSPSSISAHLGLFLQKQDCWHDPARLKHTIENEALLWIFVDSLLLKTITWMYQSFARILLISHCNEFKSYGSNPLTLIYHSYIYMFEWMGEVSWSVLALSLRISYVWVCQPEVAPLVEGLSVWQKAAQEA